MLVQLEKALKHSTLQLYLMISGILFQIPIEIEKSKQNKNGTRLAI